MILLANIITLLFLGYSHPVQVCAQEVQDDMI